MPKTTSSRSKGSDRARDEQIPKARAGLAEQIRETLRAMFGAAPDATVPSRNEWDNRDARLWRSSSE